MPLAAPENVKVTLPFKPVGALESDLQPANTASEAASSNRLVSTGHHGEKVVVMIALKTVLAAVQTLNAGVSERQLPVPNWRAYLITSERDCGRRQLKKPLASSPSLSTTKSPVPAVLNQANRALAVQTRA